MRSGTAPRLDDGMTLIELMVAMGIGSVVLTIAVGSIIQMYHSSRVSVGSVEAQSQTSIAFDRLDAELRYVSVVQIPQPVGGASAPTLEYVNSAVSPARCYRLQLDGDLLRRQTWTTVESPPAAVTLASGVRAVT